MGVWVWLFLFFNTYSQSLHCALSKVMILCKDMSIKHKESALKRWASTPIEMRQAQGRMMALAKHSQMTEEERSEHARKMSLAKKQSKKKK